jgi:hypothetical protein
MKVIKAAELEEKFPGTGRHIGKKLAEIVNPGDVIDFEGFITITNSFADEFVKCFTAKHGKEAFETLQFINAAKELKVLFKRAFQRRSGEFHSPISFKTEWQSVSELPF